MVASYRTSSQAQRTTGITLLRLTDGDNFVNQEKELQSSIDYYERLVDAKLKMLEDEEIELLLSERNFIHDRISSLPDDDDKSLRNVMRKSSFILLNPNLTKSYSS